MFLIKLCLLLPDDGIIMIFLLKHHFGSLFEEVLSNNKEFCSTLRRTLTQGFLAHFRLTGWLSWNNKGHCKLRQEIQVKTEMCMFTTIK